MPATKLGKRTIVNPVKQTAILSTCIRVAMARMGIRHDKDLAVMLGLDRSVLSKRLNHGGWSDVELWRVFRALEFTAEEIVTAMGGAAA